MDNLDPKNTNISDLPPNNESIDIPFDNQNAEDETKIDTNSGYLSHYTSIRYPCAGMIRDVKIRLPYYLSDWKLTLSYRIFAATIRIFFLNTIPALAYSLDLYLRSNHYYGVNEALLASALGG
jgi:hypothetical protein